MTKPVVPGSKKVSTMATTPASGKPEEEKQPAKNAKDITLSASETKDLMMAGILFKT